MCKCDKFYRAWNTSLDKIACIKCKITRTTDPAKLNCLKVQLEKWEEKKTVYEKALKDLGCAGFKSDKPITLNSK